LPEEILLHIFSFLKWRDRSPLPLVCHQWHHLSLDRSLRRRPEEIFQEAFSLPPLLIGESSIYRTEEQPGIFALKSHKLLFSSSHKGSAASHMMHTQLNICDLKNRFSKVVSFLSDPKVNGSDFSQGHLSIGSARSFVSLCLQDMSLSNSVGGSLEFPLAIHMVYSKPEKSGRLAFTYYPNDEICIYKPGEPLKKIEERRFGHYSICHGLLLQGDFLVGFYEDRISDLEPQLNIYSIESKRKVFSAHLKAVPARSVVCRLGFVLTFPEKAGLFFFKWDQIENRESSSSISLLKANRLSCDDKALFFDRLEVYEENNRLMLAASAEQHLRIWNLESEELVQSFQTFNQRSCQDLKIVPPFLMATLKPSINHAEGTELENPIEIWHLCSLERPWKILQAAEPVAKVAIENGRSHFSYAAALEGGRIQVWTTLRASLKKKEKLSKKIRDFFKV
jgi:hypothetical protein